MWTGRGAAGGGRAVQVEELRSTGVVSEIVGSPGGENTMAEEHDAGDLQGRADANVDGDVNGGVERIGSDMPVRRWNGGEGGLPHPTWGFIRVLGQCDWPMCPMVLAGLCLPRSLPMCYTCQWVWFNYGARSYLLPGKPTGQPWLHVRLASCSYSGTV